jgi:uncharacterized surface protein with fasciclin (FAS1) repeats
MRSRTVLFCITLFAAGLGATACSSGSSPSSSPSTTTASGSGMGQSASSKSSTTSKNIVQIAASDPSLSSLVAALKAAGLVTTLEGHGPFTVFAPSNAAFAALPAGTLTSLLEPANKSALSSILTYHVVAGAYTSSNLPVGSVKTVNGTELTVSENGGQVDITDGKGNVAHVTTANIKASNGVIHIISAVLMPPAS